MTLRKGITVVSANPRLPAKSIHKSIVYYSNDLKEEPGEKPKSRKEKSDYDSVDLSALSKENE